MGVKQSAYRQPLTPQGIKAIEEGTLTWLDEEMYNNLNTGLLEQYLEEKNLKESFEVSHWTTSRVMAGVAIGAVFSGVTAYIALKIGLAVSAAWYFAYLFGMARKWSPSEVNIATSATTGAVHASTGFIFTFPAIFLLATSSDYTLAGGTHLINDPDTFRLAFIGIVASMFAGFLGVMYFIIFRRVWLVEDPLPMPSFEATLKMLDITCDVNSGAVEHARDSLKSIGLWTVLTMGFMFLIDYPLMKFQEGYISLMDWFAQTAHVGGFGLASIYSHGILHQPAGIDPDTGQSNGVTLYDPDGSMFNNALAHTYIGVAFTPTMFAIGWFMRTRVAFLVNLGTFVGWLYLVPMAVFFDFPVFDPAVGGRVAIGDYAAVSGPSALQIVAFKRVVRQIAIGSIVGGGIWGLLKMWRTFAGIGGDIKKAMQSDDGQDYMPGKGWYEWPLKHIPLFMAITFVVMVGTFWVGGFGLLPSLIFAVVLIFTTFFLGAIAVRVMGETGIEPVSGTSFIVLLMLMGLFLTFDEFLSLSTQEAVLLGLVGTTVFGSAISMSGTVVTDYKNSLYIGNRPYHISKGNIVGVVPGSILGAGIAIFLSIQLANGTIDLKAPQANAFATFSIIIAEGQGDFLLLGLGAALGVFVEMATGMGTSFGLGMYLDLPHTLPMLIGGYARDTWEERQLDPEIERIKEEEGPVVAEKQRALTLLSTFMIAAGLLTAEAFFGMEAAIFAFMDTLGFVKALDPTTWYFVRLGGFLGFNVLLGGMIYLLFKSAGILGNDSQAEDTAA
ncbi:MAG: OPT/YSL family transporter [Candidatus Poseidoniaceae archaeon]|nr:OPT/YSL family transporter [Candidatus Poseidoniaceae archaeon]